MKIAIALAAALAVLPAVHAQTMTARQGKNNVSITSKPCPPVVLDKFAAELQHRFRAAYGTLNGKRLRGCWALVNGDTIIFFADDIFAEMPSAMFKNDPGV